MFVALAAHMRPTPPAHSLVLLEGRRPLQQMQRVVPPACPVLARDARDVMLTPRSAPKSMRPYAKLECQQGGDKKDFKLTFCKAEIPAANSGPGGGIAGG